MTASQAARVIYANTNVGGAAQRTLKKLMITSSQITVLRHLTIKTTAYTLELCYTKVPSILLSSILDSPLSVP